MLLGHARDAGAPVIRRAIGLLAMAVLAALFVLAPFALFVGCCPAAPVCRADWPSDPQTDEARADACTRAAARLDALRCREARPDFAAFCRSTLDAGVPLHPQCLASISSCAEVDARCR